MLLHDLWIIPLVQHLAGLATAAAGYAVLIRFGTRTWLAAVATIPVLFDPLQLVLEQYVLTDTWTFFLLVAALTVLVWRRDRPGWRRVAGCGLLLGLLLGLAVTFRDEDLIMIVPAALYLLVAVRPRRRLLARLGALTGCFLIPVAGYLGWFDASHGQWNFTTFSGAFLYGRVADFASCSGLNLPGYEKALCPAQPPALREADFYTWDPHSPQWTFTPSAGISVTASRRSAAPGRRSTHRPTCSSTPTSGPTGRLTPRSARSDTRPRAAAGSGRLPHRLRTLVLPARAGVRGRAGAGAGRAGHRQAPRAAESQPRCLPAVHRQRGARPPGRVRHLRLALPASPAGPDPGRRGTRR